MIQRSNFHALRHTFGTLLSKSPRVAMELMRHTQMSLTMKVYTDPELLDLAGAVEMLPSLKPDDRQAAQATGTDSIRPSGLMDDQKGAQRVARHTLV